MRDVFTKRKILTPPRASFAPKETPMVAFEALPSAPTEKTHPVRVTLRGSDFGMFAGAIVENPVDNDGSLAKDAETVSRVQGSVKRLIDSGRVRFNPPGYRMQKSDYFDAQGQPYAGYVRWEDGQMRIERVTIRT